MLPTEVVRGLTERDIALAIDGRLRQAGFSRPAFDTIVAGGPNAALPHARPRERIITEGDLVVLDFGGVYDSYCVDLTRTVSVGPATARAREVYAAVLEAHDQAIGGGAPGRSRFEIDAAARETLDATGWRRRSGTAPGMALASKCTRSPESRAAATRRRYRRWRRVAAGMVFTIEPGAYLPGWGGVRIEDDVLVTGMRAWKCSPT